MKTLILLNKIWNWRLLPDYFQRWLFDTGTRSVELLSSLWLIGFALVFWFDDGAMNVLPTYYKFQAVPEPVLIATLLLLGGSQFWAMTQRSCRSDILGGFLLLVSGLVWAIIAASFWAGYPPATTAMAVYPVFAMVCLLAGRNLMLYSKCRLDQQEVLAKDNPAKNRGG